MIFNAVVLIGFTGWILKVAAAKQENWPPSGGLGRGSAPSPAASGKAPRPVPTKERILTQQGIRFGVSAPQAPWSASEIDGIATAAGTRPTMLQFFVKWNQDFRPEAVTASYGQGALPVISWEPWAGVDKGESQPTYALARIIRGDFDQYLTRFATGVRDQRWPVAIRLAHEMNGHWYPWSERRSGNRKGEFVLAWRHIHDLFTRVGATNVIWVWSPNIIRPVPSVNLKALYPGDAYVDWIGMVGYAIKESTAAAVFEPTLHKLRDFTRRPCLITETGVQNGPAKARWITDFIKWLNKRPDITGFIWFEFSKEQGGTSDWRFSATPESTKAFRENLAQARLAAPLA